MVNATEDFNYMSIGLNWCLFCRFRIKSLLIEFKSNWSMHFIWCVCRPFVIYYAGYEWGHFIWWYPLFRDFICSIGCELKMVLGDFQSIFQVTNFASNATVTPFFLFDSGEYQWGAANKRCNYQRSDISYANRPTLNSNYCIARWSITASSLQLCWLPTIFVSTKVTSLDNSFEINFQCLDFSQYAQILFVQPFKLV